MSLDNSLSTKNMFEELILILHAYNNWCRVHMEEDIHDWGEEFVDKVLEDVVAARS